MLDIWGAGDIQSAIEAADEASSATAAMIARGLGQAVADDDGLAELLTVMRAYREGYKAALATMALAFGLAPRTCLIEEGEEVGG